MREIVYYYEFFNGNSEGSGVYESTRFEYRLYRTCDRMWRQGKQGGVKIINESWWSGAYSDGSKKHYGSKYMTKNEDAMREFAWVKLTAQKYIKEKV